MLPTTPYAPLTRPATFSAGNSPGSTSLDLPSFPLLATGSDSTLLPILSAINDRLSSLERTANGGMLLDAVECVCTAIPSSTQRLLEPLHRGLGALAESMQRGQGGFGGESTVFTDLEGSIAKGLGRMKDGIEKHAKAQTQVLMELRGALEKKLESPPPPPPYDPTPLLQHLSFVEHRITASLEQLGASTSALASRLDALPATLSAMEERLGGAALEATRAASASVLQCVKDQSPPLHTQLSALDQAVKLSTAFTARAMDTYTSPLLAHLTSLWAEASDARSARAVVPPPPQHPLFSPQVALEHLSSVEHRVATLALEVGRLGGVVEAMVQASGVEAGRRGVEEGERMRRLEGMNLALLERLGGVEVALKARNEGVAQGWGQGEGGGDSGAFEALTAKLAAVEGLLKSREATLTTLLEAGADSALSLKLLALKFLGEET